MSKQTGRIENSSLIKKNSTEFLIDQNRFLLDLSIYFFTVLENMF